MAGGSADSMERRATAISPDMAAFAAKHGIDPNALGVGGSGAVAAGEPMVVMGVDRKTTQHLDPYTGAPKPYKTRVTETPKTLSMDAAVLEIYRWSDKQRADLARRLVAAGMLSPEEATDRAAVEAAWEKMVRQAAQFYAAGKTDVTPMDIIGMYAGRNILTGESGAATPKKTIQKQVNLTNPDDARALLNGMLSNTLGRRATDEEIDGFLEGLHGTQRANPYVTTTTTDPAAGTSSSVTSGGVDPRGYAEQHAEGDEFGEEHATYQAAATGMQWLSNALRAVV